MKFYSRLISALNFICFQVLEKVSDPDHEDYGKYWSREKTCDFSGTKIVGEKISAYLKEHSIQIDEQSRCNEFITATANISVWEDLFSTKFHQFRLVHEDRMILRTEQYSLPRSLVPHVLGVFNTIDFPAQSTIRVMKHSVRNKYDNLVLSSAAGISIIPGHVTPALLKSVYKVGNHTGSSKVTQAVYGSINQSYSPSDLRTFQQLFDLPQQPVSKVIGGHAFDNACRYNDANDCVEANLDIQYIMAMGTDVPTTYHYDDSSGFLTWLRRVTLSADIANVYSIRSGSFFLNINI